MINLNDSVYDYKDYSVYGDRDHPEFVVDDPEIESQLISYQAFEKKLIENIVHHKKSIYLRFCDGEYIYYSNRFSIIRWLQKILWRDSTCRWEKPDKSLLKRHFDAFEKNKEYTCFFPHVSKTHVKMFKDSKLRDYLKSNDILFGHFYYIYHFENKLRQAKIESLLWIKIALVAHAWISISWIDHIITEKTYTNNVSIFLQKKDFSKYDLILLGWGIAAPLYANDIAYTAQCPIIDAGYMINIRETTWNNERWFSNKL